LSRLLGACAFTILLCFSAFIKIPLFFTPVPVTMQNLVVFLAGALLGPWLGFSAVLSYLALGAFGVPLFANSGAGLVYLCGPTGGYMLGFLAAAFLIGFLLERFKTKNFFFLFGAMLCGMSVIYLFGGLWLSVGYGWSANRIFSLGILPFLLPDLAKTFLAIGVIRNLPLRK
jgi:biotin transport system substrate-specific component